MRHTQLTFGCVEHLVSGGSGRVEFGRLWRLVKYGVETAFFTYRSNVRHARRFVRQNRGVRLRHQRSSYLANACMASIINSRRVSR
jgi:hypothetical protein